MFVQVAMAVLPLAMLLVLPGHAWAAQGSGVYDSFFRAMQQLKEIDELAVSPDGRWAAYTTRRSFNADDASASQITIVDLARGITEKVVTYGRPHALQWSGRSGELLTFLAATDGEERIWRYDATRPQVRPSPLALADSLGGEIMAFGWNQDGTSIAYLASEQRSMTRDSGISPVSPKLVIYNDSPNDYTGPTSPLYSRDTAGLYIAVGDVDWSRARILERHIISAKSGPIIAWSHAGKLLVSGAPLGVSWLSAIASGLLYIVDPLSGVLRQPDAVSQQRKQPTWSPSGRKIASLRLDVLPGGELPLARYTMQVEQPSQPRVRIAFDTERDGLAYSFPPMWGGDDNTLYIARYRSGTARLFMIDLRSGKWRQVTPDTLSISRYAVSRDGRTLLGVLENANQHQELFRIDPATGHLTRLTHLADGLPSMGLGRVDQVHWQSRDGMFTIHGFLIKPPAYDSSRRYPLIILVHGGPGVLFTNSFVAINFAPSSHLPPQLLASKGYMVLLPNPRGDPSYGEAFERSLRADWAPGPYSDIQAGVDALVSRGLVDAGALGIAGASYGGYLAAYAITQTERFAAASIDDAPTDLTSEYGQNYATRSTWAKAAFGGTPWTKPGLYASQSPTTYVGRVRTPVIMRYGGRSSTGDHVRQSYMLAQGFEFYAGLRDTGVPVQFVLHPYEGHGVEDWCLYEDWVTRAIAWFDYWIRQKGSRPAGGLQ